MSAYAEQGTTYLIDISDISLAELIAILYNHAQAVNMGWEEYKFGDMSKEESEKEAEDLIKEAKKRGGDRSTIDYLNGRYVKITLYLTENPNQNWINPAKFDALYGYGKALELVKPLFDKRTRNKLTVKI